MGDQFFFHFPGEGPPKFFSLDFLHPHPQIINGRPFSIKHLDMIDLRSLIIYKHAKVALDS